MALILIIIGTLSLLELYLWTDSFWQVRRQFASIALVVSLLLHIILVVTAPALWTLIILFLSLYRAVNQLRVIRERLHSDYLFHATRRTARCLFGMQLMVVAAVGLGHLVHISGGQTAYLAGYTSFAVSLMLAAQLRHQLRTTTPPEPDGTINKHDLPSLTVLIPARNETTDLEACLQSLIASTYKKLEIIVLDDCSQDKRTPEIIRSFARDGVRFIAGEAAPNHWLAKNFAYKRLVAEANSELLLFCGVDTRFTPDGLTLLVEAMLQKQKTMLSIIPRNKLPTGLSLQASLIQTGRYAWEVLLPRRYIGRPPVLSTCWLITRSMLQTAGGFDAFKQSVLPEHHLAHRAALQGDGYSFLRASSAMGLTSVKSFAEQRATGIRTRYPLLRRRPETVAAYSFLASVLLVWPYKLLVIAISNQQLHLIIISCLSCCLLGYVGYNLSALTYRKRLWRGLILIPFMVAYDIALLNYSMWQYEFHEVIWKGRNICLPIMHVIPRLPKID